MKKIAIIIGCIIATSLFGYTFTYRQQNMPGAFSVPEVTEITLNVRTIDGHEYVIATATSPINGNVHGVTPSISILHHEGCKCKLK